jgi:hypothetical protein
VHARTVRLVTSISESECLASPPSHPLQLSVGADAKAVAEAWNAVSAKHSNLAALFISSDADKGKVGGRISLRFSKLKLIQRDVSPLAICVPGCCQLNL